MEEQVYVVDNEEMSLVFDFESGNFFSNHNPGWALFFAKATGPKKCVHDLIKSKRARKIRVKHVSIRGQPKCPARSTLTIMIDDIGQDDLEFTFQNKASPGICTCLNGPAQKVESRPTPASDDINDNPVPTNTAIDLTEEENVTHEGLMKKYKCSKMGEDALLMRRYLHLMMPFERATISPDFSDYFKDEQVIKGYQELEKEWSSRDCPDNDKLSDQFLSESLENQKDVLSDDSVDETSEKNADKNDDDYSYTQAASTVNNFFSVSAMKPSASRKKKEPFSSEEHQSSSETLPKRIRMLPQRLINLGYKVDKFPK